MALLKYAIVKEGYLKVPFSPGHLPRCLLSLDTTYKSFLLTYLCPLPLLHIFDNLHSVNINELNYLGTLPTVLKLQEPTCLIRLPLSRNVKVAFLLILIKINWIDFCFKKSKLLKAHIL